MKMNHNVVPATKKPQPKKHEKPPVNNAPTTVIAAEPVASSAESVQNGNHEEEVEGYSVYIKGLSISVTQAMLEEEFNKSGHINPNGIQVRRNMMQGFNFGFVEFKVPEAVQKAIESMEKHKTMVRGDKYERDNSGRGCVNCRADVNGTATRNTPYTHSATALGLSSNLEFAFEDSKSKLHGGNRVMSANPSRAVLSDLRHLKITIVPYNKSSVVEASTAAAAPKCFLSNVLVLKEVSYYCLRTRMIYAASVYFMLLIQDLMLPVVILYVNAAIDPTVIGLGLKEEVSAVKDGKNLDKMKEKGDECFFVGYSTQSRAYRVFNKRTRVIMESIHVNFDELPQMVSAHNNFDPAPTCQTMASDQNSSDPAPECQTMALEHDSLSPGRKCQENVSHGDKTGTTSNELDLLFSPMFDELLNGSSKVVSKPSTVSAADAPNERQQYTTALNNHTTPAPTCQTLTIAPTVISSENINQAEPQAKNDQVTDDEFINIFSTPTMASVQISSDPTPECQAMALEHDSLNPGRKCQENVSHGDKTGTTSNELDLLFSPMFDELLNGSSKVVSKSSAVSAADAPNQRQQPTTPLNNHTTPAPTCQTPPILTSVISSENITQAEPHAENYQVADDEFINIFSTP
nr:Ras GTPase-activating protein-binding protein 1-like isoform X1 [Tanacetum cinerariifolium]